MNRLPVVLLTGFLGSGKTTLLNRLLAQSAFRDTAVIINEAGDVGVDHDLIETGREDVVLLEGGCICCRMKGSLNATLSGLMRRKALENFAFRRVIVETSGLADPNSVLEALLVDPSFTRHYVVAGTTTVVDALNFARSLDDFPEALMQVAVADRLLISKADLASPAELETVRTRLAALNTGAPAHIVSGDPADHELVWIDPLAHDATDRRGSTFLASGSTHNIASASLSFPGLIAREDVDRWLDHIGDLFGRELLRLKGVLRVKNVAQPVVLHGVQGLVYSPGTLRSEGPGETANRMVLIASGISRDDLADALTRLERMAQAA